MSEGKSLREIIRDRIILDEGVILGDADGYGICADDIMRDLAEAGYRIFKPREAGDGASFGLGEIASIIKSWLEWHSAYRGRHSLITDEGTAIMSLPVPSWPNHGQFLHWIKALEAAQLELKRAYPQELTPALRDALSIMVFDAGPIAHAFRTVGADIPCKAEAEQAYVLHWAIGLALEYGDDWRRTAGAPAIADLAAKATKAAAKET